MILDANARLASSFAPTAIAANAGTNVIDTLAIADYGTGSDWLWYFQVATAFTSTGSATMQLKLLGNASDPTFSSGNVTIIDTGAIAVASWVLGYEGKFKIPRALPGANQSTNNYRYLEMTATIAVVAMSAGVLNSWISQDAMQDNRQYAAGYTVA